ncbi:MAG TPA: heme lyase CcmF/NrfE family subunit [Caulobacteraceae bacterium]|nr:heme lyase CcmF/NrfE family subunit [Caulobacteraceae bacterium]
MIDELGSFALALALVCSAAQALLSLLGWKRADTTLAGAGEGAAQAAFLGTALAFAALIHAFVTSDFSVVNAAANSHTEKPLIYKIAGAWGSHEGSMLLWCFVLTAYGAAMAASRGLPFRLKAAAVGVQGILGTLFLAYLAFASNPLARLGQPPVEGASLNPLLQDPALAAHPPFLYAGYVGFSVVFSLAAAALMEGRIDAAWARWVRPWTLAAWSLLTVGISLGSFWAYYQLGWGGWWFWDPVENASLMPWLAGTALLHSALVTERRGALAPWTVFLAICAFTLSMLGAFLVRSGVLTSVHAFALDPRRGILLLSILGLASGSGFALFAWRSPTLKDTAVFAPISRESALIVNNIILAAVTAAVLIGTLWPLALEAIGAQGGVGAPYFNLVVGVLMALAFLILPAGPLMAWRRAEIGPVLGRLRWAALAPIAAALIVLATQRPEKALAAVEVGFGAWLIAGALAEALGRIRAFKASAGEVWRRLAGLPWGAWGMTFAHLGLGVFLIGAAVETSFRVQTSAVMRPGASMPLGGYSVSLQGVTEEPHANYDVARGRLVVADAAGRLACDATPERRTYAVGGETVSKVALCFRGLNDIYIVLGERRILPSGASAWLVRAYVNPLVRLIYLGPLLMAIGGVVSLSDRRLRLSATRRAAASRPALAAGG